MRPEQPPPPETILSLELQGVEEGPVAGGVQEVRLQTDGGVIDCRYHAAFKGDAAVLWVFGTGGGLGGPAGGVYTRLAEKLVDDGIASLRLDYRFPGRFEQCVLDTLMGLGYLDMRGRERVALVGHSFGGAVVIEAGVESPAVVAVAALSSQTPGTQRVDQLSPRPLLVLHGTEDEVLPFTCSHDIYSRAKDPKTLRLLQGCRHGLDEGRDELDRELLAWLRRALAEPM